MESAFLGDDIYSRLKFNNSEINRLLRYFYITPSKNDIRQQF